MSEDHDDLAKELQAGFVVEATDLLNSLESNLLQYEKAQSKLTLDGILRDLHSIKGGANAVGFSELAEFAHVNEDHIFKNKTRLDLGLLLKARDAMFEYINLQKAGKTKAAMQAFSSFKWPF